MKSIQSTLFAAIVALVVSPTLQAAPFAFTDGDLILGVQAYGGTGASQNVFFNLGSGVAIRDNGNQGQVGNIGATLSAVFGANWYSRRDLYFGVAGNLSNKAPSGFGSVGPVAGDPSSTFYISQPATAPGGAALINAATYPSSSLSAAGTIFSGVETMLLGTVANPGLTARADKSALLDQTAMPVQWNNSWSQWNPSLGGGLAAAFTVFTGGIQQSFGKNTPATYVDIQRILSTTTGAKPTGVAGGGTYEATVGISQTGAITVSTPAVAQTPEIEVQGPTGRVLLDGERKSVNFGTVVVRQTSATNTFTIKNMGNADLTGLSITKRGTANADFIVGSLRKTSLAPGATMTFTVKFKPSVIGKRKAVIQIRSNDADESPFDIRLIGTGS
jgi:hypothetical protein